MRERFFATTAEDRRECRLESINSSILEDREQVLLIDEAVSEDLGNWAEIVTALADAMPLLKALTDMPEVAQLRQSSAMPALYRVAKGIADERETRLRQRIDDAFARSERDDREPGDYRLDDAA
jgi:hypothetical protein